MPRAKKAAELSIHDRLLTNEELAEYCGISLRHLQNLTYELIYSGKLKPGTHYFDFSRGNAEYTLRRWKLDPFLQVFAPPPEERSSVDPVKSIPT